MTMKKQKTLHRFAAVAAVLLAFCLVFMAPVGATEMTGEEFLSGVYDGAVTLTDDVTLTTQVVIGSDTTINLNGHTITNNVEDDWMFNISTDSVSLTINAGDGGGMEIPVANNKAYGFIYIDAQNVVLKLNGGFYNGNIGRSGTYADGYSLIYAKESDNLNLEISGISSDTNYGFYRSHSDNSEKESISVSNSEFTTIKGEVFYFIGHDEQGKRGTATLSQITITAENTDQPCVQIGAYNAVFDGCTISVEQAIPNESAPPALIAVSAGGTIVLKNTGVYSSSDSDTRGVTVYTSGGEVTINGGEISTTGYAVYIHLSTYTEAGSGCDGVESASVTINGGTITGDLYVQEESNTYPKSTTSLTINGGTFSTDVSKYVNNEKCSTSSGTDGTCTVSVKPDAAEAKIENKYYLTLADAVSAAKDGDTITLLKNVELNDKIEIRNKLTITNNGDFKISSKEAKKLFEVYADADFKNLKLENSAPGGRCIDTRVGGITVNINNCVLETTYRTTNNQPLTIGGSDNARLSVTLSGTTINAGAAGYGIITFVPVNLNIEEKSTINGYAALYFKEGSSKSIVNVKGGSELKGENVHSGESNDFATVVFEDSNEIQLTISDDSSVAFAKAIGDQDEAIFEFKDYVKDNQILIEGGVNLELDGEQAVFISGTSNTNIITIENGVTSNFKIEEGLSEDQVCVSNGANSFIVMEKPEDAVVPETPEVTISGGDVENGGNQMVTKTSSTEIKTEKTDSGDVLVITSPTTGSADSSVKIIISGGTPVESGGEITGVTIPATATVTAEYPKTDAQGDTTTETPKVSFTLAVDIKNISKPLPVIDPAFKEDVVEDIGNKASKVLAMLSTVGDGNVNLKGTAPITITFEIPIDWVKSLGGKDRLAVFHVKDGDAKKQDIISIKESGAKYLITIKGSGFSSYALAVVEPQKSSGGAVDTGSGNYQYYPRSVPADGIVDFGTSKVVTGIELPVGSTGTVTLNIKPTFAMPENGFYAFEIDAPGYNTDAKINGGLSFQIPVADLEAAGWTAEDIVLFHGTVGEDGKITWEALPTNLVKNENGVAYYKAAIAGCSPFYIGFVKDGSVVNTEVVDPGTPETPETPVTPDEPEVLPPVDEPETPEQPTESPAPILAVLAGLGAAVVLRRK